MSDEEKEAQGAKEESSEDQEGLGAENEESSNADEKSDVEGEEEGEKEETNGRGVPLKNVVAEERRKRQESDARYTKLLEELNQKKEEQTSGEVLQSITDAEFEAAGLNADHARILRKSQRREAEIAIAQQIKKVEKEVKVNQKARQDYQKEQTKALIDYSNEPEGEFGKLVSIVKGAIVYDRKSELFKRATEIYQQRPDLRNRADGEVTAARIAELELTKSKYGAKPKKKSSKAENLKGTGGGAGGGGGSIKDSSGKYHRDISDEEFLKLNRVEKAEYNLQRTLAKNKK